jgi:uncharacterized protein (DUF2345 family)
MQIAAKQLVNVQSANGHIDWAAAKKITLKTEAGACIEISGDGVTVQCPGKIEVNAATKAMEGAANVQGVFPELPRGSLKFDEKYQLLDNAGDPVKYMRVEITKADGSTMQLATDDNGLLPLQQGFWADQIQLRVLGKVGGR